MTTDNDSQAQVVQDPDELEQQEEGAEETQPKKKGGCLRSRKFWIVIGVLGLLSCCICGITYQVLIKPLFTSDSALMAPGGAIEDLEDIPVFWDQAPKCPQPDKGNFAFEQPKPERVDGKIVEVVFVYGHPFHEDIAKAETYAVNFGGEDIHPESVNVLDSSDDCWTVRLEFPTFQGAHGTLKLWGITATDTAVGGTQIRFPAR